MFRQGIFLHLKNDSICFFCLILVDFAHEVFFGRYKDSGLPIYDENLTGKPKNPGEFPLYDVFPVCTGKMWCQMLTFQRKWYTINEESAVRNTLNEY